MVFDNRIFEATAPRASGKVHDTRVGRSRVLRSFPALDLRSHNTNLVDEAVLTVVLQRCIVARRQHGESTTELIAAHIADLAYGMGLRAAADVRRLGFEIVGAAVVPLQGEPLLHALRVVRKYRRMDQVHAVAESCAHLSS